LLLIIALPPSFLRQLFGVGGPWPPPPDEGYAHTRARAHSCNTRLSYTRTRTYYICVYYTRTREEAISRGRWRRRRRRWRRIGKRYIITIITSHVLFKCNRSVRPQQPERPGLACASDLTCANEFRQNPPAEAHVSTARQDRISPSAADDGRPPRTLYSSSSFTFPPDDGHVITRFIRRDGNVQDSAASVSTTSGARSSNDPNSRPEIHRDTHGFTFTG